MWLAYSLSVQSLVQYLAERARYKTESAILARPSIVSSPLLPYEMSSLPARHVFFLELEPIELLGKFKTPPLHL